MRNILYRTGAVGFLALLMLGATTLSPAQVKIPLDRKVGEIFVAIGNGQYQVWHPTPPTATLVETITDGAGSGSTAGCAFDSAYHPFTTNATNNDVFKDMIDDPQTRVQTISVLSAAGGAKPTSVAFDSLGNSYVGVGGGNGLIEEYGPIGTLVQTLPVGTSKLKGASPWMDLSTDAQTMYFTNLSNTITQFKLSSSKTSRFASISGATLYALRVLTPAAQNATAGLSGGPGLLLLVAAVFSGSSNIQLLNSSGKTLMTYSVTGENNFQVLTLDPNGTSFWAGNPTTENVYRFSLTSNSTDVKVNTEVPSSPSGLCAYGGFSAAQLPSITLPTSQVVTQPITVSVTLTPGMNTANAICSAANSNNVFACTFSTPVPDLTNGPNSVAITLNGINGNNAPSGLQVAYNYSQIAQAAGTSDTGLACDLTSPDGTKCEVHSVDVTPNNLANGDTSIYQSFDLGWTTPTLLNPRLLKNEMHDLTASVQSSDFRTSGSDTTNSVFSLNEQPIKTTGSQSCGYTSPLINSQYNLGRTIPFKFQAVSPPNSCPNGPSFITSLNARLVLLQFSNLGTFGAVPHPVAYTLSDGTNCPVTGCYYRLDASSGTWILNVKTSGLTGGGTQYFGTTIDDSDQIPSFSATTSGALDLFTLN
jgi:hypothetical protein